MEHAFLGSSNILGASWFSGTLWVWFSNGSIYSYDDVDVGVLKEWLLAESAGRYFATRVRGKYMSHKHERDKADAQADEGREGAGLQDGAAGPEGEDAQGIADAGERPHDGLDADR